MRHEGQVPSIFAAEGGHSLGATIGIKRIFRSDGVRIINITEGGKVVCLHVVPDILGRKVDTSLAVGHPDSQGGPRHILEHHGGTGQDLDAAEAAFKFLTLIVDEARLVSFGNSVKAWHPSEQRHELTSVADPEAEGVRPVSEVLKLFEHGRIKFDDPRPALARIQHVSIRKSSHEGDSLKVLKMYLSLHQVSHGHVPGLKASGDEGRDHLAVPVATLLSHDGHPGLLYRRHDLQGGRFRHVGELPLRTRAAFEPRLLLCDAGGVPLEALETKACSLPEVAEGGGGVINAGAVSNADVYTIPGTGGSDVETGHVVCSIGRHHLARLSRRNLEDQPRLLVEESLDATLSRRGGGWDAYVN
mmetsp:Transcript_5989/g.12795  ORF Transcript_5989/g.12795 Transcript_5989/m.12795 type:complete len:359 (-) Transcript_5989:2887-3963(-)